jgi:hypothetical protein
MSQACKFIKGHLHSPYFIFVRASGRLSDEDLLKLLGLGDCVSCPLRVDWSTPHLYLTEDDTWIHIADDWRYSLWHKGRNQLVDELHKSIPDTPIFACSVGDSDWSFSFAYYSSDRLLRRHVVEDPHYDRGRRIVVEDFGQPFPSEMALSDIDDEQDYVLSLAASLGVKLNHQPGSIRCYTKPSL